MYGLQTKQCLENLKGNSRSPRISTIEIIGINKIPIVKKGDDIAELICQAAEKQEITIQENDIIVVTHVVVSRAEGNVINLESVVPSRLAKDFALASNKDPRLIEVILRESQSVVRVEHGKIITQTKHGFVCANSGIDQSNVPGKGNVALLPENPDRSAQEICTGIRKLTGKNVAVIISDTHGRPFRKGEINVAIGIAGINPIRDRRKERDLFGYILKVKKTAIADELSCAAELIIGQADEGIPVAIIRGYRYIQSKSARITAIIRSREEDMFY